MKVLSLSRSWFRRVAVDPRRARLLFFAFLAVVVLATAAKYAAKIAKPGDKGAQSRSAFLRWREMINGVFAGENIYVGLNEYPNPPIMAILLRPFAVLPPTAGALGWFGFKVLLAGLAAVWAFRLANSEESGVRSEERGTPPSSLLTPPSSLLTGPDAARAAAVLLCLPALLGDLSHNNVNIFILFLVAGCLEAFRRRLDALAGLTLALAVACKVTPLLFLGYFVWKRCWRVVAATLAGLLLWLALVPGLAFGWDRNRELLGGWYALMVERPLLKGEITTEHPNQAVTGVVYRLLTYSPSYIVYVKTPEGDIPTPGEFHNLTDIGRPAAWAVVKLLTAAFAVTVVVLCRAPVRGPTDPRGGWRVAAECGLICLGMLLFSERTWKHHAVVLLIPLAALTFALATADLPRRARAFGFAALGLSFALTAGPGLLPGRGNDLAMVYGTHTLAFALLAAATGVFLACGLERPRGSGGLDPRTIPE